MRSPARAGSRLGPPASCRRSWRPEVSLRHWRPRRQPRRFPSSSLSPTILSGWASSQASPGQVENMTGIDILSGELSAKRLELLRQLVPAVTRVAVLVNPANAENPERDVKGQLAPSGCKPRCSTPVPSPMSTQRSQILCVSDPMPFSSVSILFLMAGASNWSNWRHSTTFPHHIPRATSPKPAG